jgi:CBS domain containing-hemolysin-like protein
MLSRLQKIPRVGEGFDFDGRRYSVKEMDGLRIASVKIEIVQGAAAMQQAGD